MIRSWWYKIPHFIKMFILLVCIVCISALITYLFLLLHPLIAIVVGVSLLMGTIWLFIEGGSKGWLEKDRWG